MIYIDHQNFATNKSWGIPSYTKVTELGHDHTFGYLRVKNVDRFSCRLGSDKEARGLAMVTPGNSRPFSPSFSFLGLCKCNFLCNKNKRGLTYTK